MLTYPKELSSFPRKWRRENHEWFFTIIWTTWTLTVKLDTPIDTRVLIKAYKVTDDQLVTLYWQYRQMAISEAHLSNVFTGVSVHTGGGGWYPRPGQGVPLPYQDRHPPSPSPGQVPSLPWLGQKLSLPFPCLEQVPFLLNSPNPSQDRAGRAPLAFT